MDKIILEALPKLAHKEVHLHLLCGSEQEQTSFQKKMQDTGNAPANAHLLPPGISFQRLLSAKYRGAAPSSHRDHPSL